MKKIKLAGIAAMALFTLTACGTKESTESTTVQTTMAVETTAEQTTDFAQATAKIQETEQTESDAAGEADTAGSEQDDMETGTYPDGRKPEFSGRKLKLTIDGEEVVIAMYDNTAADAFLGRLPLENLEFFDLSGIEKPVSRPEEPFSLGEEEPGYDPVTGEMVIYRPWGNFTIFYGDFRYSDELVPLGKVESGLELVSGQSEDFTGTLEIME